jgi:hypothetical protein
VAVNLHAVGYEQTGKMAEKDLDETYPTNAIIILLKGQIVNRYAQIGGAMRWPVK